MNNLDNTANSLIDELESLQTTSRELKMKDFVDKFDEYFEEIGNIKEDLSCKISDEIENEQMKGWWRQGLKLFRGTART